MPSKWDCCVSADRCTHIHHGTPLSQEYVSKRQDFITVVWKICCYLLIHEHSDCGSQVTLLVVFWQVFHYPNANRFCTGTSSCTTHRVRKKQTSFWLFFDTAPICLFLLSTALYVRFKDWNQRRTFLFGYFKVQKKKKMKGKKYFYQKTFIMHPSFFHTSSISSILPI